MISPDIADICWQGDVCLESFFQSLLDYIAFIPLICNCDTAVVQGTNESQYDSILPLEPEVTMTIYDSSPAPEHDFALATKRSRRLSLRYDPVHSHTCPCMTLFCWEERLRAATMDVPRVFSCDSYNDEIPEVSKLPTFSIPRRPSRCRSKQKPLEHCEWESGHQSTRGLWKETCRDFAVRLLGMDNLGYTGLNYWPAELVVKSL